MKIVVIGGTGLIGSKTVKKLQLQGHEAIAAAPSTGVNALTGKGLAGAMTGAQVVVDVSNSPSFDEDAATNFFETSGRNLAKAEADSGVRHHVALSVVGTDRLQASGYFRAKLAQERLIEASPIPYSLVHATQFFEFIRTIADLSTNRGAVRLPPVQFQPMAADDVAAAISEIATREPLNNMMEIGGPETFTLDGAVRRVLEFDRDERQVIADDTAPYYGVQVSDRTLVPDAGARMGPTTLGWWVEHVPPPPKQATVAAAPEHAH